MIQVWENLTGSWEIFLAGPPQDVEQGEEQVQPAAEEAEQPDS